MMTDKKADDTSPNLTPKTKKEKQSREERLSEALRQNLKRRKPEK